MRGGGRQATDTLQELERTRTMLLEAEESVPAAKAKVGAVTSRASPEPLALACIEPAAGAVNPGNDKFATNSNLLTIKDRMGNHEYAWGGFQVSTSRARWSFRGNCTEV